MAVTAGERALAVEWIVVVLVQTGDALAQKTQGGSLFPNPSRYFASMIAFLFLAAFAMWGRTAKLAGQFGALVMLVVLIAPPDRTQPVGAGNRPLILRFLRWLNSFETAGAASVATPSTTSNLPGGQAELNTAIAQAQADVQQACSGSGANSAACAAAKQRLANIQSLSVS